MPESSRQNRLKLISLPIFWQVLGLGLCVLVLALVTNTIIVLKAPEPPPSGYSLSEAVQALKTGEVKLSNGRKLKAETLKTAPAFMAEAPEERDHRGMMSALLAQRLAGELHVPADTITVHMDRHFRDFMRMGGPPPEGFHKTIRFEGVGRFEGAGPGMPPDGPPPEGMAGGALPGGLAPGGLAPGAPRPDDMGFDGPSQGGMRMVTETRTDIFYPPFSVAWRLQDGRYRVITPPQDLIAPWQMRLLIGFGLTALLILPLAWWLSQRLSRPIIAFSEAAAKVGIEDNAPPVLAVGPREVRQAAHVLNAMQERIRKQVENRTAMMGAIAHDLKTPLARMRLRIEDLPSPLRDKLSEDIGHMDGLIRSAMSFTSAHRLGETLRPLDLSALAETLADDLAAVCTMETPLIERNVMVKGDTVALKRILTNLVENAGRYATSCRIELAARGPTVEVSVIDNGPGLSAEMLETVFEPFYRMESSRNRVTGGTGLGLSVARSLSEAQGGKLVLLNRYEGKEVVGLEARLTMPRLVRTG